MTGDDYDEPLLICSAKLEHMDSKGCITKSISHQKTSLYLGRNEFKDVILKIEIGKLSFQYILKDITIHKRFLKEGKASIKLNNPNMQILMCNCPPSKLSLFLKTLTAKVERLKSDKPVSAKQRLLSEQPRTFDQISPLSAVDINALRSKIEEKEAHLDCLQTPKARKRKQEETGKDVICAKERKTALHRLINPVQLTMEQKTVLNAVLSGRNIFFTGSAGTGKSFLLKRILGALPPESTFATASTGVAACQIGGITLHSFAGIGSGNAPLEQCIQQAMRKSITHQWKKCQHLVVDEISMVDGEFFQKLEKIARVVRNNDKPFGGIQLILSGDFLQLPPVCKSGETRVFCFQSSAWDKCVEINIELTKVMRQKDPEFINLLQAIRKGRCSESMAKKLMETSKTRIEKSGILATRLNTHRDDVDFINESKLKKLSGDCRIFSATDNEPALSSFMNKHCPVGDRIELKIGAQVMLTKNIDVQKGLVNGARGVVTGFEAGKGLPIVRYVSGTEETVKYEKWSVRASSGALLIRKQLPLKLAWAMSIHKSQGMTLDCVEVSLMRVFENGQAYVALSRAKSLDGLRVMDFEPTCIKADRDVLRFYTQLQQDKIYRSVGQKNTF